MKPAQAGALTTPLPESCRAASSARIASRALWSAVSLAESAAFVAHEASSVASALARDAGVTASKLRDEGLGGETQQGICYFGVYLQRRVQPGQRAGVRLAEEGRTRSARWRPPWRPAAPRWRCLCLLGGQRRSGDGPQESVGHLGVRRDPRRYVQGVLVHHRLEAVVGGHRGQCGVVGRGDGTVHGRRGAVVGQLQVHAVRGALGGHHALQHVEGRLALLEISELCSAAMLLPCAATCPSVVARAAAVARGAIAGASALLSSLEASSAVTLSSRDWMAAALLPDAAVFTARSVT